MIQQTIDKLRAMHMGSFAAALAAQLQSEQCHMLSFEERISLLVEEEFIHRENRKVARTLKLATLKLTAQVEGIDLETRRNLRGPLVSELSACSWVRKGTNLLITGPTGVGKTYLACALAEKACQHLLTAKYYRLDDLLRAALYAQADGTYPKMLRQLMKVKLLILDEWLRAPISPENARILADILDDRYERLSTLCVSQFPIKQWYKRFTDPTIAEAILDRLVHNARKIELEGESMRKKKALEKDSNLNVE